MLLLTLAILSVSATALTTFTALTGYALAADNDTNISTNTIYPVDTPVDTAPDTIAINESINVINITNNSNETTVAETIIKEESKKSSPGFLLTDTMISLITVIILVISKVYIKKNKEV
jgi:hypothetical protein